MQYKEDEKRIEISKEAFNRPDQAKNYALFRPNYPEFFFKEEVARIVDELKAANGSAPLTALDLGCGSGQATFSIAKHFDRVVGVDINASQLNKAVEKCNESKELDSISFMSGDCSKIESFWRNELNEQPVHSIFICQAFHWFNQSDIIKQCKTILEPTGGVLFLLGYSKFQILPSSAKLEPYFEKFYSEIHDLFDFDRKVLNNYYKDVNFKEHFNSEKFIIHNQDNLSYPMSRFIGYLDTFSAYRNKLERIDKSPEEDSLKILLENLGFKGYDRGKLNEVDYTLGPNTVDFTTPFFMYILKNAK
jgi:ubiquinone/menaquinone biosynthesis C-methylase UbiE